MRAIAVIFLLTIASNTFEQSETPEFYTPARFLRGKTPGLPPLSSAGGLTVIELEVAPSGIVTDAVVLDEAAPYTELLRKATILWQFQPAKENGAAVASKVLIIGAFRPPVLMGSELPEPRSIRRPSDNVPYPAEPMVTPEYPPNALYEGVAMVEVEIDDAGAVLVAKMLSAEQGFDDAALDAAAKLRFKAARHEGRPVDSFALIVFGFRQPLTTPRMPRR